VRQQLNHWPLSVEMSTAVRWRGLGRVNFGALLVNLDLWGKERATRLHFLLSSTTIHLDTWMLACYTYA
jgi:hypothetical protein